MMAKTETKNKAKGVGFNISMLYIMNIAKLIFPLITLPYLTRVLSVECYGVVSYVKATMVYAQLIVDFGFMLSGVKEITQARDDNAKVSRITGNVVLAKAMLCVASFAVIMSVSMFIPILKENLAFTVVSFVPVALTILLLDFLFRGLEQMHIITLRYVVMRGIAVVLTFALVRSDADIMWIPLLDIVGSIVAIALVFVEVRKLGIKMDFVEGLKGSWKSLKLSGIYFVSEAATTVFGAFNTILVGIFLCKRDVAYWAICLQLVAAVKAMYTPVTNGIYPKMIQTKDIGIIKKSLKIFMPLIVIGCLITLVGTELILTIVGSAKYAAAAPTMRALVPVLFFCFPAMLFGWPTLGAINRVNETTKTTISAAGVQLVGLALLGAIGQFNLIGVALVKSFTEFSLMSFRLRYCFKFKNEFVENDSEKDKEAYSMKGIILKLVNLLHNVTKGISDKTREILMYICITGILANCYYYQIDDYLGHVCPAMVNAAIGTLFFFALLMIGANREFKNFEVKIIPVALVMMCGFVVVLSGLNHYIGYSYIAMGLFMLILAPLFIVVWQDTEQLEKLFRAFAIVSTVLFALFCIIHVLVEPAYNGAYMLEGRYMGMSFNPNGIAKTAVIGSISALYCTIVLKKAINKMLSAIVVGCGIAILWLTQSRANFIALFMALFFLIVILIRNEAIINKLSKNKIKTFIITIVIVGITIPVACIALNWNANKNVGAKAGTIAITEDMSDEARAIANETQETTEENSSKGNNTINRLAVGGSLLEFSSGRVGMWITAIKEATVLGHDMKNFKYVEYAWSDGTTVTVEHAHNTCIELLNRSGIIAGCGFLLLELYCAIWILVTTFNKHRKSNTQIFAVLGVTAFGIASLFDIVVLPFAKMTVFVFYICLAEICSKRKSTKS